MPIPASRSFNLNLNRHLNLSPIPNLTLRLDLSPIPNPILWRNLSLPLNPNLNLNHNQLANRVTQQNLG